MSEKPQYPLDFPDPLLQAIRSAHTIIALTGAGISAESGIPTFRQTQTGLWEKYRAEDLATPEAFERNPRLVWEWYAWRRDLILNARPNPGHLALVEFENHISNFNLITQNVDNLHRTAGNQKVIEFHGNIFRTKCSFENILVDSWIDTGEVPPRCPKCRNFLRPDVVWFGEAIPTKALSLAYQLVNDCQVFISIGTSAMVEPAASLSWIAHQHGSILVEINLEPTPLTNLADFAFKGHSGEILPELVSRLWTKK